MKEAIRPFRPTDTAAPERPKSVYDWDGELGGLPYKDQSTFLEVEILDAQRLKPDLIERMANYFYPLGMLSVAAALASADSRLAIVAYGTTFLSGYMRGEMSQHTKQGKAYSDKYAKSAFETKRRHIARVRGNPNYHVSDKSVREWDEKCKSLFRGMSR